MSVAVNNVIDTDYKLYINGQWVEGAEGKKMASYSPSTGEKLADFIDASYADVDAAV
jgi:aldehyde dehydrogenase (NAD+)